MTEGTSLTVYVKISELTLLENNPRKIDKEQFNKLCKSLEEDAEFFFCRPCLVASYDDGKLVVYAGNQRVLAAKKLGWKQVPCIIYKDLSEETIKSRIAKDNQHYGDWDYDILAGHYEIDTLIDAGFRPEDLIGDGFNEIEDIESKKSPKPKNLSMCPHCGHQF